MDMIKEVAGIPESQTDAPPRTHFGLQSSYIDSMGKTRDRVKILLNVEKILFEEEQEQLQQLHSYERKRFYQFLVYSCPKIWTFGQFVFRESAYINLFTNLCMVFGDLHCFNVNSENSIRSEFVKFIIIQCDKLFGIYCFF